MKEPVEAARVAPSEGSNYPQAFRARVAGREKRRLGEHFGLRAFGVNLTRLRPGAQSALLHRHTVQEEFLYVLEGECAVVTEAGEALVHAGMCMGFTPAAGAHHLVNRSNADVVYLEIGSRETSDEVAYPRDDLKVVTTPEGKRVAARKDGTPY